MRYKTPKALEMAIKEAAKASPMQTERAILSFYYDRFLCRVFQDPTSPFVLKGGQSLLARTIDARATRDIDLVSNQRSLDAAVAQLQNLIETDLDDHIHFEFIKRKAIKEDEDYRSGVTLTFTPWVGSKRLQNISIDLVVDQIPVESVESIRPAARVEVEGIPTHNYFIYPVERALADKICAITERHHDHPSTRVKDLVDIILYATTCDVDATHLQVNSHKEAAIRKINLPKNFIVPTEWTEKYQNTFRRICAQTSIPQEFQSLEAATKLAGILFNPILATTEMSAEWDHKQLRWRNK